MPVGRVLPVVGRGSAPSIDAVEFRAVRATGRYDAAGQVVVRNRSVGGQQGFYVLTPLRTSGPTLLVVRGFLDQPASGAIPVPPAPPSGTVTVRARAQAPEPGNDHAAQLADRQVATINPAEQAPRLGGPVYDGYAELEAGQPGTGALTPIPKPNLSNPAGGALEPQHFAYVIQWYLFALLALAAPIAMARAETRHRPTGDIDAPAAEPAAAAEATADGPSRAPSRAREAKLADRYGRPARR